MPFLFLLFLLSVVAETIFGVGEIVPRVGPLFQMLAPLASFLLFCIIGNRWVFT